MLTVQRSEFCARASSFPVVEKQPRASAKVLACIKLPSMVNSYMAVTAKLFVD
jgi:hypothetical protein